MQRNRSLNNGARVLVADDEAVMRDSCHQSLEKMGLSVSEAENGDAALEMIAKTSFDLLILDLKMPGTGGMDVLKRVKRDNPTMPVVVITGYATVESAVEAMKQGADDFLPKPFTPDSLRLIVRRALSHTRLAKENRYLRRELDKDDGRYTIVGESKELQAVRDLIRRVAPTDSTVLITGESGTGKELVARAIHRHSQRADKPFVVVDCCTLVGTLLESELFGHAKGSFTGASATTHGRFELADGGTIFLDEIGNIGSNTQAKLLRVIQEREFTRVGSSQVIKVDIRIIAATNKDLIEAIRKGVFREDLYYRLSVVPIVMPPLRHHLGDVVALADFFLERYSRERRKNVKAISPEAMKVLVANMWPGNVRELENAIERAVILTENDVIHPSDLLHYEHRFGGFKGPLLESDLSGMSLAELEKQHIQKVLKLTDGNRTLAARQLGIDRKTLWRKMSKYGITTSPG